MIIFDKTAEWELPKCLKKKGFCLFSERNVQMYIQNSALFWNPDLKHKNRKDEMTKPSHDYDKETVRLFPCWSCITDWT